MASDNKDDLKTSGAPAIQKSDQSVAEHLDLDKNPIKYKQYDGQFSTEAHDKDYMELTLRSGKHSELVQKLLRQRIELRAKEFPRWPAENTGGTRYMWIESRFWYDRERLGPDFDQDWREYRAKYLHSLELDPREPVHVPEYETELINPIRRFYMKGGDFLEDKIIKRFARDKFYSSVYRVWITRSIMSYFVIAASYYWIRYTYRNWDVNSGPRLTTSRPTIHPNHPKFPYKEERTEPAHFSGLNFLRRNIYKDLRDFEDITATI